MRQRSSASEVLIAPPDVPALEFMFGLGPEHLFRAKYRYENCFSHAVLACYASFHIGPGGTDPCFQQPADCHPAPAVRVTTQPVCVISRKDRQKLPALETMLRNRSIGHFITSACNRLKFVFADSLQTNWSQDCLPCMA